MMTCPTCKYCFGRLKKCLLRLKGEVFLADELCGNYLAQDLYAWVHLKSVEMFQGGFQLVGDKHQGTLHQFRFMRGDHFPDIREIVYNTTQGKMWGKVINDLGQQLEKWDFEN